MKIVYGAPDCIKCEVLKKKLEKEGVEFKYINVRELDAEQIDILVRAAGTRSLPIVFDK